MPLSLDDLRKTTSLNRRTRQRAVAPVLMEPDAAPLAAEFCRYWAEFSSTGQRQRDFQEQRLTELAGGDFKLARGLISTMQGFYAWEAETFEERLSLEDWQRMQDYDLPHSSALRLAFYDFLSLGDRPGYAPGSERAELLELFSAGLGLDPLLVEVLLYLDTDEQAVLRLRRRNDGQLFRPPEPGEVLRRYNRLAVETMLYNSSEVVFSFGSRLPGALIKQVGYLSRELHIPYDLDYTAAGEIQLRLFGPVQAFGATTRHGDRLAQLAFQTIRAARQALPAAARNEATAGLEYSGPRTVLLDIKAKTKKPLKEELVASGFQSAVAVVHIRDKEYHYDLAAQVHYLAPYLPEDREEPVVNETISSEEESLEIREAGVVYNARLNTEAYFKQKEATRKEFDSAVEARFYEEFAALAREGHTAGWQIEREPEAVAVPSRNLLFIPDFALRRGDTRIWLEVIGFWTPGYRTRKLEKLEKLKADGGHKLLLAVAQELKQDFTHDEQNQPREMAFPTIFYKHSLRVTEVLALLQRQYDDQAGRMGLVGAIRAGIEARLTEAGYVGDAELYRLLKVYSKSELDQALQRLESSGQYLDGYGLCQPQYLARSADIILAALDDATPRLIPEEAAALLQKAGLPLETASLDALLERLPGLRLVRPSLFEVYVQSKDRPLEEPQLVSVKSARRIRK